MLLTALDLGTTVMPIVVTTVLMLSIFIMLGIAAASLSKTKLINQPLPSPISDHEQLWSSSLFYDRLGSGEDLDKLVVYTMDYINTKNMSRYILDFDTERGAHSAVFRIVVVTTLPSFNHQYQKALTLTPDEMDRVASGVIELLR